MISEEENIAEEEDVDEDGDDDEDNLEGGKEGDKQERLAATPFEEYVWTTKLPMRWMNMATLTLTALSIKTMRMRDLRTTRIPLSQKMEMM